MEPPQEMELSVAGEETTEREVPEISEVAPSRCSARQRPGTDGGSPSNFLEKYGCPLSIGVGMALTVVAFFLAYIQLTANKPEEPKCGRSVYDEKDSANIVGGEEALEGQWPWQASL